MLHLSQVILFLNLNLRKRLRSLKDVSIISILDETISEFNSEILNIKQKCRKYFLGRIMLPECHMKKLRMRQQGVVVNLHISPLICQSGDNLPCMRKQNAMLYFRINFSKQILIRGRPPIRRHTAPVRL